MMQSSQHRPQPVIAWRWLLAALVYYMAVCLAHLQFSLWLVRGRDTFLGRMAFADLVPGMAATGGLVLLAWIAWQVRRSARSRLTIAMWLLWLLSVVMIDQFLTFSTNEYVHYPQYALLAWLVARTLDAQRSRWVVGRVLFWTTLMGMGDELLQYLWTTTSYSNYLDFNDFLTNLVAAAAGMLLYYGTVAGPVPPVNKHDKPVKSWLVAGTLTLLIASGLLAGRIVHTPNNPVPPGGLLQLADGSYRMYLQRTPDFYGSYQAGPRHGRYFVLPPMPGLLIMLGLGWTFLGYGRLALKN